MFYSLWREPVSPEREAPIEWGRSDRKHGWRSLEGLLATVM
jgi:hypothetical protein